MSRASGSHSHRVDYEVQVDDVSSHPLEPLFQVCLKDPKSGELVEVRRTSLESAFRTFGRRLDFYAKQDKKKETA